MRRSSSKRKELSPDPKFNNILVSKFVNNIMMNGKKNIAFEIFYSALEIIENKTKEKGLEIWKKALDNVSPGVEVRSRRIGGAVFQIPQEVRPERRVSLGMKWIISYARQRKGKRMQEKLADEIIAAYKKEGGTFKKKEEIHRMAEANKAFSHFKF